MKNITLILLILCVLPSVYAFGYGDVSNDLPENIGSYKLGECVNLIQTCANCTYVNITSILYPNSTKVINEVVMTKEGTYYNYSFCNTTKLGEYKVNGHGDENTIETIWSYSFDITREGDKNENGVYIAIWLAGFILLYFGFIHHRKVPLYKLFGYVMIFFNGLIGVFVFDSPIVLIITLASLIFMFKGFIEFSHKMFE